MDKYLYLQQSQDNNDTPVIYKRDSRLLLTSIEDMIKEFEDNNKEDYTNIVRHSTYVGCINTRFIFIQYDTQLCLINLEEIMYFNIIYRYDLFYQLFLYSFSMYGPILFTQQLNISDLLIKGKELCPNIQNDKSVEELIELLLSKAALLIDYFGIGIIKEDDIVLITQLPQVIMGYHPDYYYLSEFIYKLSTIINWEDEYECFKGIIKILSEFYKNIPNNEIVNQDNKKDINFIIQHFIYPSIRDDFIFQKQHYNKSCLVSIVSTKDLYKVFERC